MVRPRNPCDRNCKERSAECHAECEKYAIYRKEMDEYGAYTGEQRRKAFVPRREYAPWEAKRRRVGGQK